MRMNSLSMSVVIFCAAMMTALYQPFISVWVKDDPALVRHALTPVLMVLYFYVMQSRQVLKSRILACGSVGAEGCTKRAAEDGV